MKLIKKEDGKIDIVAVQGKTWRLSFKLSDKNDNPIDITNVILRGHIKKNWRDTSPVATWTIEKTDAPNGEFSATIAPSVTATIECGDTIKDAKSQYVYDLEVEFQDGNVMEIMKGRLFVEWEVTK